MAELAMAGLSKTYRGGVAAVRDFSLTVADGERLALLGPSGCGKTTLLRLVAGLEIADAGEVRIGGCRVDRLPPHRRGVAMVFQESALYPHLTVEANLGFGLKLAGTGRAERRRRVQAAVELLGLADLLDRRPGSLSGGQAQRVALGRALVREPAVLLLDEPLAHLDAPLREELLDEIRRLHARVSGTLLFVTHDQREAMALGQRIAVQRDGRLVQAGTPRELLERPACLFVAEFLGLPRANTRVGRLRMQNGSLSFGWPDAQLPLGQRRVPAESGSETVLGVRPEHITLCDDGGVPARFLELRQEGADGAWRIEALGAPWLMRAPRSDPPAPGDCLTVQFQVERAHFFRADTGKRVETLSPQG